MDVEALARESHVNPLQTECARVLFGTVAETEDVCIAVSDRLLEFREGAPRSPSLSDVELNK